MIIDQLFEDDKKKKLNEIDPRNYDSDEDYYNDLYGDDDDEDFDGDAADDEVSDMDNDEESHYEKYVRVNNLEEAPARGVDAKGRTQQQWIQAVYKQFPDARIVQAKMIDGPCHAMLPDGRKLSWNKVEQGIAESIDRDLRLAVYQVILDIHFGAKYGDEMIDTVTDELGDYFDDVEASDDAVLKKVYAYVRREGAEAEGDPARMDRVALNAIEFLNYEGARGSLTESRRNKQRKLNEAMLMEDPIYRNFKRLGRYIAERKMTEKEILDVFAAAEQGMTNKGTGANRTMLGRGKDAATKFAGDVSGQIKGVLNGMRNSVPMRAVEVAYDQATDALANVAGGQNGPVMNVLKQYRNLAKEYPKTTGLVKSALIMVAGMATGGAAPIAIIGALGALDRALKGDTLFNSLVGGVADSALAGVSRAAHTAFDGNYTADLPDGALPSDYTSIAGLPVEPGVPLTPEQISVMQLAMDSGNSYPDWLMDLYKQGTGGSIGGPADQLQIPGFEQQMDIDAANDWINADAAGRAEIEKITGLSPEQLQSLATNNAPVSAADSLSPGEEIVPPDGAEGLPGQFDGGQYTVQDGDQIGRIAQANGVKTMDIEGLNPQIDFSKPLQKGMVLNLPPQGDGTGSVWDGYTGGNYGDKAPSVDLGQGMPDHPSAASDYGMGGDAPIDYSKPGPTSTDSLGNKLEYGIPVNDKGSFMPPSPDLPAKELATQQAAYDAWKSDFMRRYPNATQLPDGSMQGIKPGLNTMQIFNKPTLPAEVQESVKIKKLSFDKLVDQKTTVMAWALNESVGRKSKSVNLTTAGTYTVFENVDRYRKALLEYVETGPGRTELPDLYRPDMINAPTQPADPTKKSWLGKGLDYLDKGVKKVGSALSNFGHQFTTNVTKEKLKMDWHQAGKPSDSDQLAAWLVKQGVPQDVVTSVYSQMGIPYTGAGTPAAAEPAAAEPAAAKPAAGGAQKQMAFYGTNPATKKPWTYDELQAKATAGKTPAAAPTDDATADTPAASNPAGFNAGNVMKLPGMEKYAKKPAAPAKTPNFAGPSGYAQVNQPTTVSYSTGKKPAAAPATPAAAPAGTRVVSGGPTPDEQARLAQRIAQATAKPVAEMLQMVETKEDVAKIKQFVDQTFVKYGAVSESAFVVRNKLIEHITQVGAQRRREYARKS